MYTFLLSNDATSVMFTFYYSQRCENRLVQDGYDDEEMNGFGYVQSVDISCWRSDGRPRSHRHHLTWGRRKLTSQSLGMHVLQFGKRFHGSTPDDAAHYYTALRNRLEIPLCEFCSFILL